MKKALIILTACILCLSGAFADIDGAKVEGNATLTYGFDFENQTSGFDNESEFTITLPLIANKTAKTTKSSGDSYAEISFKDLGFTMVQTMTGYDDDDTDYYGKTPGGKLIIDPDESFFNDKDTMDMSAKLVFKKMYMTVYNRPAFTVNYAQLAQVFDAEDWDDDIKFEPGTKGWGTSVGFTQKGIDLAVRLGSYYSYDNKFVPFADDANITDGTDGTYGKYLATEHNDYAFGVTAKMTPSPKLTLETAFNTVGDGSVVNAGVSAAFTASPTLKFTGAFDAGNTWNDGTDMDDVAIAGLKDWGYDALLSGEYTWKKNAVIEGGAYFTSGAVDNEFNSAVGYTWVPGVQVVENQDGSFTYTQAGNVTSFVTLTNKEFIPGVDAKLTMMFPFMLNNGPRSAGITYGFQPVVAKLDAGFKTALGDVNYYKPFAKIAYQNFDTLNPVACDLITWMAFEAGVEYGLFTNTTVTGTFTLGETADDAPWFTGGYVSTPATGDSGSFTIACKVTY